jgi:hypothetical protein
MASGGGAGHDLRSAIHEWRRSGLRRTIYLGGDVIFRGMLRNIARAATAGGTRG